MEIGSRIEEKDPINAHSEDAAAEDYDEDAAEFSSRESMQNMHIRDLQSTEVDTAEYQTIAYESI